MIPSEKIIDRVYREEEHAEWEIARLSNPNVVVASPFYPIRRTAERCGVSNERVVEVVPRAHMGL